MCTWDTREVNTLNTEQTRSWWLLRVSMGWGSSLLTAYCLPLKAYCTVVIIICNNTSRLESSQLRPKFSWSRCTWRSACVSNVIDTRWILNTYKLMHICQIYHHQPLPGHWPWSTRVFYIPVLFECFTRFFYLLNAGDTFLFLRFYLQNISSRCFKEFFYLFIGKNYNQFY